MTCGPSTPASSWTENWNAYPLHAGYNTNLVGAANPSPLRPALPSASRKGNTLTLDVMPFSDSTLGTPERLGLLRRLGGIVREDHRSLRDRRERQGDRGGNPLRRDQEVGPSGEFHTRVALSPHPATVRFVLDATRKAKIYAISTASHTVWTWRSRRESGARLPAGWTCGVTRREPQPAAGPARCSR